MLFAHHILQAFLTFVDDHSHKVTEFFEFFCYVFLRGCTVGALKVVVNNVLIKIRHWSIML